MTGDPASLQAANAAFYERFEALDFDAMAALWDHGADACCVHPGSELIVGWGPVRRSWAAIFAATDYLQFIITDTRARVMGAAGVVTCTENVLADADGGAAIGGGRAVATNVFVWRDGAWYITAHHASPVLRHLS